MTNNGEKKLSPTEQAIIDLMKRQNLGAGMQRQDEVATTETDDSAESTPKRHAFWDTQVRTEKV